jgi:hypothetical protein
MVEKTFDGLPFTISDNIAVIRAFGSILEFKSVIIFKLNFSWVSLVDAKNK